MNKIAMLLFAILLFPASAHATAQIGDTLIYKGQNFWLSVEPLEHYFAQEGVKRPPDLFKPSCSACWRGYVATWEVTDGALFLNKVVEGSCGNNAPEIPLDKLFPGQKGPIMATWFSGTIRAPHGKLLEYVHMGYSSRYEKELVITIEKGKIVKEEVLDNSKVELKDPPTPPTPPKPTKEQKN